MTEMEWNGMEDKLTMVVTETLKCYITSCCRVYRLLLLLLDFISFLRHDRVCLTISRASEEVTARRLSVGRLVGRLNVTVTVPR